MHRNQMNQDNDRINSSGGYGNMNRGYDNDQHRGDDNRNGREHRHDDAFRHTERQVAGPSYAADNRGYVSDDYHPHDDHDRGRWGQDYADQDGHRYQGGMIDDHDRFRRDEARMQRNDYGSQRHDYNAQRTDYGQRNDYNAQRNDYGQRSDYGQRNDNGQHAQQRTDYGQRNDYGQQRTEYGQRQDAQRGYADRNHSAYSPSPRTDYDRGYARVANDHRGYQSHYQDRDDRGRFTDTAEGRNSYGSGRNEDHYRMDRGPAHHERSGYGRGRDESAGYGGSVVGRQFGDNRNDNDRRWTGGGYEEDRRGPRGRY